jgi:hypothetical protein
MAERDPDEWDREIEADFQSCLAANRAEGKVKRQRKKAEAFVKVPLWWIELAAKRTGSPTTLVLIELLYAKFRARSSTFKFSNVRLQKLGVSRDVKRRVLHDLAKGRGRMIVLEQKIGRAPVITLIGL